MTDSPKASPIPALEEGALRLLGRREHSRKELRGKLRKREWPAVQVDALLDRLEEAGALSDLRFARSWIRHRAGRGLGPSRIRGELRQRGVAPDVVARAFQEVEEEEALDWGEVAARWYRKKYRGKPPQDRTDLARRIRSFLGRGFARHDFPQG